MVPVIQDNIIIDFKIESEICMNSICDNQFSFVIINTISVAILVVEYEGSKLDRLPEWRIFWRGRVLKACVWSEHRDIAFLKRIETVTESQQIFKAS
jgi:hypothetical protein